MWEAPSNGQDPHTEQKGENELSTSIHHSLLPDSGFNSRLTLLPPGLPHQLASPTKLGARTNPSSIKADTLAQPRETLRHQGDRLWKGKEPQTGPRKLRQTHQVRWRWRSCVLDCSTGGDIEEGPFHLQVLHRGQKT